MFLNDDVYHVIQFSKDELDLAIVAFNDIKHLAGRNLLDPTQLRGQAISEKCLLVSACNLETENLLKELLQLI